MVSCIAILYEFAPRVCLVADYDGQVWDEDLLGWLFSGYEFNKSNFGKTILETRFSPIAFKSTSGGIN